MGFFFSFQYGDKLCGGGEDFYNLSGGNKIWDAWVI